jgi:hypothetical protein
MLAKEMIVTPLSGASDTEAVSNEESASIKTDDAPASVEESSWSSSAAPSVVIGVVELQLRLPGRALVPQSTGGATSSWTSSVWQVSRANRRDAGSELERAGPTVVGAPRTSTKVFFTHSSY